jgi:hypothetical protein
MQPAKILVLALFLLWGRAQASIAVETALPLPTAVPMEASIAGTNEVQADRALHAFAMACGVLAFAAAGQQALFPRKSALQRIKAARR